MNKFAVHKGKAGIDFGTVADKEWQAIDKAWRQATDENESLLNKGPFSWWNEKTNQWGQDKWYVRELVINDVKPASVNKVSNDV